MPGWSDPDHRLDAQRPAELFREVDWLLGSLRSPDAPPIMPARPRTQRSPRAASQSLGLIRKGAEVGLGLAASWDGSVPYECLGEVFGGGVFDAGQHNGFVQFGLGGLVVGVVPASAAAVHGYRLQHCPMGVPVGAACWPLR